MLSEEQGHGVVPATHKDSEAPRHHKIRTWCKEHKSSFQQETNFFYDASKKEQQVCITWQWKLEWFARKLSQRYFRRKSGWTIGKRSAAKHECHGVWLEPIQATLRRQTSEEWTDKNLNVLRKQVVEE